jgi:hypothetical protein
VPGPEPTTLTALDGATFRDLDHDGRMAPFEDPRLSPGERADDLLTPADAVPDSRSDLADDTEDPRYPAGAGPVR